MAIVRLNPLFTDKSTVENPPKIAAKIQWVQPRLVCEVAYAEWTQDVQLRQTTFLAATWSLQTVYDLAAKRSVGLRFNRKICPQNAPVYHLTAIDN